MVHPRPATTQLNATIMALVLPRMPLQERIPLRAVCRTWCALVELSTAAMTSVVIFGTFEEEENFERNLKKLGLYEFVQLRSAVATKVNRLVIRIRNLLPGVPQLVG